MKETVHEEARNRFLSDPTKCYQRHVREVWGEQEQKPKLTSLKGARVEPVTQEEASSLILKYEWLGTMGAGTKACYGLKLDGETLGVCCFNKGVQFESRNLCGAEYNSAVACLCRGACVPHAPKDAGSYLVRHSCRQAARDHGWKVFIAYSDSEAGEIGTIYQAVGWKYLGASNGRAQNFHTDFVHP